MALRVGMRAPGATITFTFGAIVGVDYTTASLSLSIALTRESAGSEPVMLSTFTFIPVSSTALSCRYSPNGNEFSAGAGSWVARGTLTADGSPYDIDPKALIVESN